jgi:hypothetical protein
MSALGRLIGTETAHSLPVYSVPYAPWAAG